MAIQLTPEQEQRIEAVVKAGAYPSAKEAVDAAVAAVESLAAPGFQGTEAELGRLLAEGLGSGEPIEVDERFWGELRAETDRLIAEQQTAKRR